MHLGSILSKGRVATTVSMNIFFIEMEAKRVISWGLRLIFLQGPSEIYGQLPSPSSFSFFLPILPFMDADDDEEQTSSLQSTRVAYSDQSSDHVSGFSMMEQVRLCAVWPMENWLGTSKTTYIYRVG